MEEKIINMNQFLGAAQGDQEHMLGKFLYLSERSTLWFCGSCVNSSASAIRGLKNSMTTSPAASRL